MDIIVVGGAEGAPVDLLFCWVGISGRYGDEDDGAEE